MLEASDKTRAQKKAYHLKRHRELQDKEMLVHPQVLLLYLI